eukprot:6212265-Pleurochrysis_carterae.AAC.1
MWRVFNRARVLGDLRDSIQACRFGLAGAVSARVACSCLNSRIAPLPLPPEVEERGAIAVPTLTKFSPRDSVALRLSVARDSARELA